MEHLPAEPDRLVDVPRPMMPLRFYTAPDWLIVSWDATFMGPNVTWPECFGWIVTRTKARADLMSRHQKIFFFATPNS